MEKHPQKSEESLEGDFGDYKSSQVDKDIQEVVSFMKPTTFNQVTLEGTHVRMNTETPDIQRMITEQNTQV